LTYDDFFNLKPNDNNNIVYIGVINSLHYKFAYKCLENGYNVIIEKPFTTNYESSLKLVELAKSKNL